MFHTLSGIDSQPARKFISPKIAVHLHPGDKNKPYEGSICVIWTENTTGNGDVNDNGTSFESTQNLGAYLAKSSAAQIAVYQDNVYVVWSDDTTGRGDIYFRVSVDNGAKFGGRKVLAKNNGSSLAVLITSFKLHGKITHLALDSRKMIPRLMPFIE